MFTSQSPLPRPSRRISLRPRQSNTFDRKADVMINQTREPSDCWADPISADGCGLGGWVVQAETGGTLTESSTAALCRGRCSKTPYFTNINYLNLMTKNSVGINAAQNAGFSTSDTWKQAMGWTTWPHLRQSKRTIQVTPVVSNQQNN